MNEVKHREGKGWNVIFDVYQNGKQVGTIQRNGNNGFRIYGFYQRIVGHARTSAIAAEIAKGLTFPSAEEAYEAECAEIYQDRLKEMNRHLAPVYFELGQRMASGSNTAIDEMRHLVTEVERYCANREGDPRSVNDRWMIEFAGKLYSPLKEYPARPGEDITVYHDRMHKIRWQHHQGY